MVQNGIWKQNISTETNYNSLHQWAQSCRGHEPIIQHDSPWTWHYREMPTWAELWLDGAKWTNTISVCACVPSFECVHVRVCLHLCCPVKVHVPVFECALLYQQECFCCQSKGQLIIWSAASPVVVTAADCHEERCWTMGECMSRIMRLKSVMHHSDPSIGKGKKEFPTTSLLQIFKEIHTRNFYKWINLYHNQLTSQKT